MARGCRILPSVRKVDGNQIRGRIARCSIKTRRENGALVNLIAVCSTDIAIDTIHFRLRIEALYKLVREFPDMPDMEIANNDA
jgi:hypothetical protein